MDSEPTTLMRKGTHGCRPGRIASWGGLLGEVLFRLDRPHRIIARRNLGFAFPEWTKRQVASCARRVFRNLGKTLIEIAGASTASPPEIMSRCRVTGESHLHQALAQGDGVILVSAHLGNWEIGLQYLACRFRKPIGLVVRPLTPASLDRLVNRWRGRFGNRIIYKKQAFPAMMKTVREGGITALMVDMSVRKQSVPVHFFGHRARASHAAALLAARSGAALLPLFSHRGLDGRLVIDIGPLVSVRRSRNLKNDLRQNTQILTDLVETAVRRHPDQYLWVQKRWKDYHPQLYPGYRPRPGAAED
ncbi:MAG: hypothetical protein R6V84_15515 [Desulfobacterales bacterium]